MKPRILKCNINHNKKIARGIYLLGLKVPVKLKLAAGQFFMLRVAGGLDPLLGRPLDWFYYTPGKDLLEFVYQVVGRGTEILSQAGKGRELSILGPLGKGWDWNHKSRSTLLIAGGLGIPGLWDFCLDRTKSKSCAMTLLWGAKSKDQFFLLDKIPKSVNFMPVTEDGSFGAKGLVTEQLKIMLSRGYRPEYIYSCGPQLMLKALAKIAADNNIPGQVLYTERMACGFGACMGCAVPATGGGYLHVCTDGPSFRMEQIDWERVK
jgi:dihydroorotate dehydrogenase electron transfer subunit